MSHQKRARPANPADAEAILATLERLRTEIAMLPSSPDVEALLTDLAPRPGPLHRPRRGSAVRPALPEGARSRPGGRRPRAAGAGTANTAAALVRAAGAALCLRAHAGAGRRA